MKNIKNLLFFINHINKAVPFYFIVNIIINIIASLPFVLNLLFIKFIMDSISGNLSIYFCVMIAIVYCITITVISCLVNWHRTSYIIVKQVIIQKYFNNLLFNKLYDIDIYCYENTEFYDRYIKAINEIDKRTNELTLLLAETVKALSSIIFTSVMVFYLSPIFLVFTFLAIINSVLTISKQNELFLKKYNDTIIDIRKQNYIKNLFYMNQYIKEIKIFNSIKFFKSKYEENIINYLEYTKWFCKKIFNVSSVCCINEYIINFGVLLILIMQIFDGKLGVSDFVTLLNSVMGLTLNAVNLFNTIPQLNMNSKYIENLINIINFKSYIREGAEKPKKPINSRIVQILMHKVCFAYPNNPNVNILKNVNLKIYYGQKIAIVGGNGSGKSTMLKLLMKLYNVTEGEIKYYGESYNKCNTDYIQSKISVVFQDFQFYAFTIAENILMREVKNEKDVKNVYEALIFCGLFDKVVKLKNGINTVLTKEFDDNGVFFSQGELQKLSIARAYIKENTEVIIMDEMTSALDAIAETDIFTKITNQTQKTIIFITHNMNLTIKADKIIVLDKGEIVEEGNHLELIHKKGIYARMFNVKLN